MKVEELKEVIVKYLANSDIELINIKAEANDTFEVELDSLSGVGINQCIELSKHVESQFDRDKDDFELTVASYSISSPFVLPLHFKKNIGRDVEALLLDGTKIIAVLTDATEEGFTLEYDDKVAVEGKKRKVLEHFTLNISYKDAKTVKLTF